MKTVMFLGVLLIGFNSFSQINFEPAPDFFRTPRALPLISLPTTQTILVSSYGAIINDGLDDTTAIQAAIDAAVSAANGSNPVEVLFEEGVYDVTGITGDSHTFFILNSNNIVVNGNKAQIMLHNPEVGFLRLYNCENIIVKDLIIDYAQLPFTQGVVVAVDYEQNYFDLEIDEGYPLPNEAYFLNAGQNWGMLKQANGELKYGASNLLAYPTAGYQLVSGNTYRSVLSASKISQFEVGDYFVQLARNNGRSVIYSFKGKQITYINIATYSSPSGTFNANSHYELNILNCKTIIKPNSGRVHSTNADCIHISGGSIGPWVQGCEFSGYADDAVNLKHTKREILAVESATQIIVKFSVENGDILRFFNPRDGIYLGDATATNVTNLGSNQYRVQLSNAIQIENVSSHQLGDKCYIDNKSNESFVFRNNIFKNARRYGMLLQSTYGIIEGNTFENLSNSAIRIENGVDWGEGFVVNQIKIDGNYIYNCGYDKTYLEDELAASITIQVMKLGTPCDENATWCGVETADWQGHKNITISNNTISYNSRGIHMENVDTALIKCNDITSNGVFSGIDLGAIYLNNNSNVINENDSCDSLAVDDQSINQCWMYAMNEDYITILNKCISLSGVWFLYDFSGRLLATDNFNVNGANEIDISRLKQGIYILRTQSEQGYTSVKFIKP